MRRSITATDPVADYNGRAEFLIDAAVFPGSSGSPVYIASEGINTLGGRLSFGGSQVRFLGVLFAVYQYTSEGSVELMKIPTAFDLKTRTKIPAGLGLVMKAGRLNDFNSVFEKIANKEQEMRVPNAALSAKLKKTEANASKSRTK